MKKNYIFKIFIILVLFLSLFIISGCKEPEKAPDYNVEYFNSKLDASGFTGYSYTKTIKSDDIMLLEEKANLSIVDSKYILSKEIKRLDDITSDKPLVIENTKEEVEVLEDPIQLTIEESDFDSVNVNEKVLTGKIKETSKVLGYDVNNLELTIELSNEKVVKISISYNDIKTGLKVDMVINYLY